MLELVTFLYGKPCEKDGSLKARFLRFYYWFMVLVFTYGLVSSVVYCFFDVAFIPATIIAILVIPVFSRFTYSVFLKMHGLRREK